MPAIQRISPCLWFDGQAEEAAEFYVGIFPNSRITAVTRYGKAGFEVHGRPDGSVMVVAFELDGAEFTALNGGPHFKFSEAISLQVFCDTQEEIDYYWDRLGTRRRPQGAAVRLAEGQVWPLVASRTTRRGRVARGREFSRRSARDGGDVEDEEGGHCRAPSRV